jgi:multicomponent Na+:H+ antiporter subunit D
MFTIFQPAYLFEVKTLEFIFIPLAILAMLAASVIAIFQTDLKRLLAYSSLAQIGYMLLGIGMLSETGLTAAVAHLFNHGITKAALFMGVGALVWRYGNSFCDRIAGAGKVMPWTSAAMVIAGLSLIGVPGTAGFVSKWVLVQGALEAGWWPVAMLIMFSSLLAVVYVWRMVEAMYLTPPPEDVQRGEAPLGMLVPMWIMALACIFFGLDTDLTLSASITAAKGFIGGSAGMMVH